MRWSSAQICLSCERRIKAVALERHYLGASSPMSNTCAGPKDISTHKACVSHANVWAVGIWGSVWHTPQMQLFWQLESQCRVGTGQNKLKLTLVTSLGSALWEGVSQADSCHFKFHSRGTMHFIFGKRIKQRRREQCRQIYICFSIYAKPRPLHHLSYQLFRAAIEYIDL